ncbi:MAG: YraN family protein [candidate division WOR-3 bacterium]|nr:YraN family protein [candidate division WOR-3 bacterium]
MHGKDAKMKELGKKGESLAEKYLEKQGFKILAKNYRCPLGEIDIIAKEQDTIVFIEVKTRHSDFIAEPFESVGRKKQMKLRNLAEHYLAEKDWENCEIRFDVLSIVSSDRDEKIEHIKNAF